MGSGHPEAAQNPPQRGREVEGGGPRAPAEAPSAPACSASPSDFQCTAEITAEMKNFKTVILEH